MKRKGFLPNRRLVLAGLMSGAADRVLANGPTRSLYPEPRPGGLAESVSRERRAPAVESLVTEANLGGEVTFAVIDAQTGEVLETRKPFLPMPPASVAKALTATYGLSALGPEHRFRTCLMTDAPIEDGILQGDLVLVGTGDPTLDTDGLAVLAAQLKPIGIFEVKGKLLTYGASLPQLRLIDASQPDHVGYNPSVSGLNLNFNRVHFEWKRAGNGYALAMDARTQKYRPAVSIARISVADRRAPVYSYQDLDGVDDWTVARTALGNGGSRWLPTRVPDAYCSDVFRTLARSHGISMADGGARSSFPAGHRVLAEWQSAQLRDIVGGMLRYSTNLTAEVVGLSATRALGGEVSNLRESGAHMASWFQEHVRMP
ncbi:MAG: D-alanyl-D-alanine carboxypeptidase, partial [Pseudomonadota bacterium]